MRSTMADELVIPAGFHAWLGVSIAVQIFTTAVGLARDDGLTLILVLGGLAFFAIVTGVQLLRFRRLNGVWLGGLASSVVLGSTTESSIAYGLSAGFAIWSAFAGAWWLVAACAVAGGAAYAWCGARWVRAYRNAPSELGRGQSTLWLATLLAVVIVGLAGLLIGH